MSRRVLAHGTFAILVVSAMLSCTDDDPPPDSGTGGDGLGAMGGAETGGAQTDGGSSPSGGKSSGGSGGSPPGNGGSETGGMGGDIAESGGANAGGTSSGGGEGAGGTAISSGGSAAGGAGSGNAANGQACSADSECASGTCSESDGVCCDLECDGECRACVLSKTGYADGTCTAVKLGTDPDAECPDEGASSCGSTGEGCNGDPTKPQCVYYEATTECSPAGCEDHAEFDVSLCDGEGTCVPPTSTLSCGAYNCASDHTTCLTGCATGDDCREGYLCVSEACVSEDTTGTIAWLETWEADPFWEPDGRAFTLDQLVAAPDGDIVYTYTCYGEFALPLACPEHGAAASNRIDSVLHDLHSTELGYRILVSRESLAVNDSGGMVVGISLYDSSTANLSGGIQTYYADGSSRWKFALEWFYSSPVLWITLAEADSIVAWFQVRDTGPEGSTDVSFDYATGELTTESGPSIVTGSALAKYDADGQLLWAKEWTQSTPMRANESGELWVATEVAQASSYGCAASGTPQGLLVAKLSPDASSCTGKSYDAATTARRIEVFPDGGVVLLALLSEPIDFGNGELAPIADIDLVLARFNEQGDEVWSRRFAWDESFALPRLSVAATSGHVLIHGEFDGTLHLGDTEFDSSAGETFLARFAGSNGSSVGHHQAFGAILTALDPSGSVLFASVDEGLDMGQGPVFTTFGHAAGRLDF